MCGGACRRRRQWPRSARHPSPVPHPFLLVCSVAAWRQEALEFQQQLDGLLLETPPQQQAAIGSGADASLTPGSAGGQPPLLDASDLHLPTLQEEMIRQLVTEHGQQQQQQQQQGEPPGAAPLVPAASMQPPLLLPIPWDQPIVSPAEAGPALPFPLADAAGAAACATGSVGDAPQQQQQQQQEEQGQVQAAPVPAQQEDEGAASQPQPAEPLAPSQQQSSPPAGRAGNAVTQLASAEQRQQQGELEQQQQAPAAAQAPSQQEQQGQPPPPAGRDEQESVPRGEAAAHPGGSAAGGPQRSTRSRMRGGSSSPPAEPSPPAASLQQPQQPQAQLPNPSSAEAAGPPYTSAPVGLGWDVGALLGMLGPQHPLLLWPELSELLALPPLLPPGLQPQQADAAAGSGDSGGGGGPRRERKRSRVEEGLERKPEVAAVLESYRQRAEAARQRRRHQHQAAACLLASIADSGACPACPPDPGSPACLPAAAWRCWHGRARVLPRTVASAPPKPPRSAQRAPPLPTQCRRVPPPPCPAALQAWRLPCLGRCCRTRAAASCSWWPPRRQRRQRPGTAARATGGRLRRCSGRRRLRLHGWCCDAAGGRLAPACSALPDWPAQTPLPPACLLPVCFPLAGWMAARRCCMWRCTCLMRRTWYQRNGWCWGARWGRLCRLPAAALLLLPPAFPCSLPPPLRSLPLAWPAAPGACAACSSPAAPVSPPRPRLTAPALPRVAPPCWRSR